MKGKERMLFLLKNIKEKSPILLIGGAAHDFREVYKGPIREAQSVEDVRTLVSYYMSVHELDYPLVISDLGFMSAGAREGLLKFVEESPLKLILLATFDTVSPVLLSRMKGICKYHKEKVTSEFMSVRVAKERIAKELEADSSAHDRMMRINKYSPLVHYYNERVVYPNQDKILSILGV